MEWLRARARASRWEEERQLVREEMRRTLVFLSWRANQWQKTADLDNISAGLRAYSRRQTTTYNRLGEHFKKLWVQFDIDYDVPDLDYE